MKSRIDITSSYIQIISHINETVWNHSVGTFRPDNLEMPLFLCPHNSEIQNRKLERRRDFWFGIILASNCLLAKTDVRQFYPKSDQPSAPSLHRFKVLPSLRAMVLPKRRISRRSGCRTPLHMVRKCTQSRCLFYTYLSTLGPGVIAQILKAWVNSAHRSHRHP